MAPTAGAPITTSQCKAARGLLGWSQSELAARLRVTRKTIYNFEHGETVTEQDTLKKMREIFEDAGIELIDVGKSSRNGGSGARWKDQGR